MTTYCAPCLADIALVRESVTTVNGTASCMAHAVLLTHPNDTAQRRLTRLTELRTLAESKLATASSDDVPAIELLVQEYALAGAMDMTVPLRDLAGDRTPRPPKSRRNRPGRGEGGRPEGPRAEGGRPEGPRPERGERGPRPAGTGEAPAAAPEAAPEVATDRAPEAAAPAAEPTAAAVVESAPAPVVESAPAAESAPAPQEAAPSEA